MNKFALTYDDIQLIPRYSEVKSRSNISLNTLVSRRYGLLQPFVAAPMDTVCEEEMAYKLFLNGGVGSIHRFMSIEEQSKQVFNLKNKIYNNNNEYIVKIWKTQLNSFNLEFVNIPIMAAIGVLDDDIERAISLVNSGANILIIDVAHGHHLNVITMIKKLKKSLPNYVDIIAGNIATHNAAIDLQNAGADGLRVGIGGGSLCSTRIKTGFGVPNVTALENVISTAKVPVMADGGIRTSGDIAKALAIGASSVMLGSLLAGTDESPGKIIETKNGLMKRYRGSASLETKLAHGKDSRNVEGESTMISYKGGVKYILNDLSDGVKSALSYAGANNLAEFTPNYAVITSSGIQEAKPHLIV